MQLYHTDQFNYAAQANGAEMARSKRKLDAMHGLSVVAMAVVMLMAGCGKDVPQSESARTVLVVQPGAAAGMAGQAFAGEVHARQESPLAFRIGGNLVKRLVDAGQAVRQGQLLAELDPGDARLQAEAARADLLRLEGDLARYRKLLAQQLISRSAFDAQEAAYRAARAKYDLMRNQDDYTRLRAPRAGVIASRQAEAGQVVAAGQTVFVLAADGGREVAISLPEARIRDFSTGQRAVVVPWSAPDARLPGTLREIAAAADPQTRTYAARVALDAAVADQVELGQSARVFIADAAAAAGLRLPLTAVQRSDGGGSAVWVVTPDSKLRLQPVRLGAYGEDSVPVLEGVGAGAWVVAAGGHLLRAGEQVKPVDRRNRPVVVSGH